MKTKKNIFIVIIIVLICSIIVISQYFAYLRKAHSTFEDYYKFRGCNQLVEKTDTYGICIINSGETIKIVKFEGRWFLDGDLPYKIFGLTF